jgi:hypothetical protein
MPRGVAVARRYFHWFKTHTIVILAYISIKLWDFDKILFKKLNNLMNFEISFDFNF